MAPKKKRVREKYLTIPEVAKLKGVTRTAVLYAVQDGRLEAIRVGRMWAIPSSALEEYVPRSYRRKPTSARRVPLAQAG
jgi:excisionase family DNA binding protein